MIQPATSPANRLAPQPGPTAGRRSLDKGDVPTQLLDRYLIERDRQGRPERYYRDHKTADPAFRDHGRSLSTIHAYPDSVAAMLKVAQHRAWAGLKVSGDSAFRREVWIQARALGMDVKGYKPTERDRQAAGEANDAADKRRNSPKRQGPPPQAEIKRRLDMAAVVVRTLIADPAAQARLMERAWARVRPEADRSRDRTDPARKDRAERSRTR
nr:LPD7 domain-containing protein [uncultured Brevundimonas sp.]